MILTLQNISELVHDAAKKKIYVCMYKYVYVRVCEIVCDCVCACVCAHVSN
jgi:hypothetical protein